MIEANKVCANKSAVAYLGFHFGVEGMHFGVFIRYGMALPRNCKKLFVSRSILNHPRTSKSDLLYL